MCCGLFGVQIVWALHNVNTSRIFQTFGADIDELAFLWIAAPAAGLLVQPIVGYLSDRTWGRLGRRRPYMLLGAILSAAALVAMPNVATLWAASVMLWILIAAINIVMEPFRVLVADSVPAGQRTLGFALQVFFIGTGAVFASALPWLLHNGFDVGAEAPAGLLPPAVRIAFYIGAIALLASVGWSVFTVTEPTPAEMHAATPGPAATGGATPLDPAPMARWGWGCIAGGVAIALLGFAWLGSRELYVLAGIAGAFGVLLLLTSVRRRRGAIGMLEIVEDIVAMPTILRHLGAVQFFTWFGFFAMWIFMVPAVAARHFGTSDIASRGYALAADRVSLLFAEYNGVAAVAALLLPRAAAAIGRRASYALCLLIGAGGLLGFVVIDSPDLLWVPTIGIGIAWAAVLSLPYAMLAEALPAGKRGVYMGIHNIFLVLPQLVAASVLGNVVQQMFDGRSILALALAAACLVAAACCCLTLPQPMGGVRRA